MLRSPISNLLAALGAIAGLMGIGACASLPERAADRLEVNDDRLTLGDSFLSDFYFYEGEIDKPGVLLKTEQLGVTQSNPGAGANIRLLYSSTDGLGGEDILPVSGVLFLPEGAAPAGGWPLMAWTHGTVGIADVCAPSWDGRQMQDREYLEFWLKQGFAVVASDYQGLGTRGTHPYLATRPEAYSNLDIIRAVQSGSFPVSNEVLLFGQSQGAGAAVASAAYAPEYASELAIVGVVATGVPFFSPETLVALQEARPRDVADPLLAYNLLALSLVQRTDANFRLEEYVSDRAMPIALSIRETCHKQVRAKVVQEGLSYNETFKRPPSEHLVKAFARMGYPTLGLRVPLFVGTGGKDRDTPLRMQAALVRRACAAGTQVTAVYYPELDHRGVVPASTADSISFARAAFSGELVEGNCGALPY
ncbi:lipase family protein [Qipengyuania flava]|uniref:lipase family protein n=1 Tax=Qipengyuania flava TaxID=192812 RepID=UPI001C63264A|nr:lipase family protein [Qipengyuania flava]QYJ08132.1 lipase family protein [Qipengyuania flava]